MAPFTWACAAFYLGTIFGLQRFMKNKAPLNLRPALVAWSAFLALFSIIGTIRLIPERFHTVQTHGWTYSVCTMEYHSGPVGFWTFLYVLFKIFEFGDTVFYCFEKTETNIPSLVSSCCCDDLCILCHSVGTTIWKMVCNDKLCCPCDNVQLLHPESLEDPSAENCSHDDNCHSDCTSKFFWSRIN